MGRDGRPVRYGLIIGITVLLSSCGGGGGGGSPQPQSTFTPLPTVSSRNERTEVSSAGSITLQIQDIDLTTDQPTPFHVFLRTAGGAPAANQHLNFTFGAGLEVTPADADRFTGSDGALSGTIRPRSGGVYAFTVAADAGPPYHGLSVTLTVSAPFFGTPVPGGTVTPTGSFVVPPTATATATATPESTVQAGGLQFVGAAPPMIGVRGAGLPEQSVLTFQVTDKLGAPLAGVPVAFSLVQVSDESLAPATATSDDKGTVQVTLTSGQRALSVQVTATVTSVSPPLVTRSTAVNILGGPQSLRNFSLSHQFHNISGRVSYGLTDTITAYVADRFGNPVPPLTVVNFTTNGGAIGNQTTTSLLGQATATLVSQLPIPTNGIVSTLATTRGDRPFNDLNSNGACDAGDELLPVPEPYYDSNCNGTHDDGEQFVDLNQNGIFDSDQGSGTPSCDDEVVIFGSICTTFSGQTDPVLERSGSGVLPAGGSEDFTLTVTDDAGNPIVGGSTIDITVQGSRAHLRGLSKITIVDAITFNEIVDGVSRFRFSVDDSAPASTTSETDTIVVTISSAGLPAGGNSSVTLTVPVSFLAAATPTVAGTPPTATPQIGVDTATPLPPTATPTPTNTPAPRSIVFLGAQPSTIGVRGSGRPEQSVLKFRVTDALAQPAPGIPIRFSLTSLGGESVAPEQAISDADGVVQAVLTSGTRAISVRVTASVVANPAVNGKSTAVIIQGGQPAANRFSFAPRFQNIAGRVTLGLQDPITVFSNDRFGNAVPAGTAVTFQSDYASIVDITPTDPQGRATGTLLSEGTLPPAGIVTLLVYTEGEKAFTDVNGNGAPDPGEPVAALPEPFFDRNGNHTWDPGEPFIDLNSNGTWDADQEPVGAFSDHVKVFATSRVTFSGPTRIALEPSLFTVADSGSQRFTLTLPDDLNNPLVPGTRVAITVQGQVQVSQSTGGGTPTLVSKDALVIQGDPAFVLNDSQTFNTIVDGLNRFTFSVADAVPGLHGNAPVPVSVTVTVTSPQGGTAPGGNGSVTISSVGTLLPFTGTFTPTPSVTTTPPPAATPTPTLTLTPTQTPTLTPTLTPTPTATVEAPRIAPATAALFAGAQAPPNCDGAAKTFVVTGGAPPFTISAAGVGCLNTTLVSASGGSFTFTSGNEVGTFLVTATDGLGRIATTTVTQQGPPATLIDVDLFENLRTDNGDGSFTSVATALVTDGNGVTVADGVPVQFSIVDPDTDAPISGVSITSPGFTNAAQPCTVTFPVLPQPGDALACIKYITSRQGSRVKIRAKVTTSSGSVLTAERTVTLPDTRPTATPTTSPTPAATNTPTISPTPSPFPTGQATFTPSATPSIAPTAPVGSIAFISALPATIGVRASGLPEQSVVTFQAKDTLSRPIVGAPVAFQLTGSGSEILNPTAAITDANGMVSTTVTSGFRATTVRITAQADSNGDGIPDIFVQSQVVGIVGAPPAFNHFSVAPAKLNVPGRVTFGIENQISAYVNDRFGNAVPPQTSVSFITNAASVVNPTVTNVSGIATATLLTEGLVPPTGIVTVLAFTRGEESFLDNNGNGKFDCSPQQNPPCQSAIDSVGPNGEFDDTPEPHIDFRPLPSSLQPDPSKNDNTCTVSPPSHLCNAKFDQNTPFELFVDSNVNGLFDSPAPGATGNGFGQGTHGQWDNNIFVWGAVPVTFSGHLVTPVASPTSFAIPIGGSQLFTLEVHDDLWNPIVGGSTIAVTSSVGSISGGSITVPDGESFNQIVDGLTRFSFVLSAGENVGPPVQASIVVTITSPNGNGTFIVATGTVPKAN
jgi:hypothetical protein